MTDLLEMLTKWFSKPVTLKRLAALLVFAAVALCIIFSYERYTFSFRLARLQKEAELLGRLEEIEARGTNQPVELEQARKALREQVIESIKARPMSLEFVPSTLTVSMNSLWKFLAGGAGWFLSSLYQIRKWKTKTGPKDVFGTFCAGLLIGFFAIFVPPIWWPWFHLFVYPVLFMLMFMLAITPLAIYLALKMARHRAETVSCTNNLKQIGLAARIWAANHGDYLPENLDSLKTELGDDRAACCPAGKNKGYEILSPGISSLDPTEVYARCPVHNILTLADGTVRPLGKDRVVREGRIWKVKPAIPSEKF